MKQVQDARAPQIVQIHFPLTDPYLISSKKLTVQGKEFWVSACVLPGMDPHMTSAKQCQDMCFFETDGDLLLCGEFDGHGPNGRDVAQFCAKTAASYFNANRQAAKTDSFAFLEAITKKLDNEMRLSTTGIDVTGSGS